MRILLTLALIAGLGSTGAQTRESCTLVVHTFPPGAQVYLETSTGPTLLGLSGSRLEVRPPALRDRAGRVQQFVSGTLTLKLVNHQALQHSVPADQWSSGRIPAEGSLHLVPDHLGIAVLDRLRAYPPVAVVALVGVAAGGFHALRLRRRLKQQSQLLQKLQQPQSGDPLVGCLLGDYRVQGRLGQGGMGTVYRVTHPDGGTYAAKVLYSDQGSEQQVARFRREARLIGGMQHSNLVRCLDFGEREGLMYYVMDLVEGHTFAAEVHPQGRPWNEVWKLLRPVVLALQYAHSQGIVHRDLKPGNLMVDRLGLVKVLDFGLARESQQTAITRTGESMGTPTYVAPEQLTGRSDSVEPRTDQYSLGIILYEMLVGQPPFTADDPIELLSRHLLHQPPRLRLARPDLPLALDLALVRMLAKEPKDRFADMAEVLAVLDDIAGVDGQSPPAPSPKGPVRPEEATEELSVVQRISRDQGEG